MTAPTLRASIGTTSVGGVLLGAAGLLRLLVLTGSGVGSEPLLLVAAVLVAIGACVLALGLPRSDGIAGGSRIGRVALVALGAGPLVLPLPLPLAGPPAVVAGMTGIWLLTLASVVAAVAVVRAHVLRGPARWVLLLLAADAVLAAVVSTVPVPAVGLGYLALHADLLRPVALLVCGVALVLHGRSAQLRSVEEVWRRSTDVAGGATRPTEAPPVRR